MYKDSVIPFNQLIAEKLINSIKNNKMEEGLKIAKEIILRQFPYIPDIEYLDTTKIMEINSKFFNPPFTAIDFKHWQDMYKINSILKKLKKVNKNTISLEIIFKKINNRIKNVNYKDENERPAFFSMIWDNHKGDILDKYLLFSILSFQAGYNTQMALIFNKEKKQPLHLVAESVKNGKYFTCDFYSNMLWAKSLSKLLKENSADLKQIWKNRWTEDAKMIMYKAEYPALSYRKCNQLLGNYLSKSEITAVPLLEINPIEKQSQFKESIKNKNNTAFIFGIEPFLMIKNSNFFLNGWKYKTFPKNK